MQNNKGGGESIFKKAALPEVLNEAWQSNTLINIKLSSQVM